MTSLTIAMVAVTTWNYAGFMADPPPPVPPPPAVIPAPPTPPIPPGSFAPTLNLPAPSSQVVQLTRHEAKIVVPPAAAAPPEPTRYRMADRSGQVWEHADPAVLQAFVEAQNARMVFPQPGLLRRFRR